MAMINSYLVYQKTGGVQSQVRFRIQVIRLLIQSEERDCEMDSTRATASASTQPFFHHKSSDKSHMLGQHFPDMIASTSVKAMLMKRCVVCYKQGWRKETCYHCETCMAKPALCITPCFKIYHTHEEL